jgi:hypothetical protein
MKNVSKFCFLLGMQFFSLNLLAIDGKKPVEVEQACVNLHKYHQPVAMVVSNKFPKIGYFTPCFDENGTLKSFENKGLLKPNIKPSEEVKNTIYEHLAEDLVKDDGVWVAKDKKDRKILFMKGKNFSLEKGGFIELNALKNGLTDSRRYRDILVRKNENQEWEMVDPSDNTVVNHLYIKAGTFGVEEIIPLFMDHDENMSDEKLEELVSKRKEQIKVANKERKERLEAEKKLEKLTK